MKHLLPESGRFYKANLHMHTTVSDGRMTPEETKAAYQSRGYSIVAFSDHEVILPHPELCDEDFLAITSTEYCVAGHVVNSVPICYHLNFLAKRPDLVVSSSIPTSGSLPIRRSTMSPRKWQPMMIPVPTRWSMSMI